MSGGRDRAQSGDAAARRSGADLTPFRAFAESVSVEGGELVEQVSALIDQAQAFAAALVNATLTLRNWYIGRLIDVVVLPEGRSGHDQELVASLAQQVSWTHFRELLPLAIDDARALYVREIIDGHLSARNPRYAISRKAFDRREFAASQIPEGSAVQLNAFRDPVLLDLRDPEAALRRDMEALLLEVGRGWAFVECHKRMMFDGDGYYLDLLFYSRPLRRLIAIGKFKPSYQWQMNFYVEWPDRYERQPDENPPIGPILCTEASRDQIELLGLHKDGKPSSSIGRRSRRRRRFRSASRRFTGRRRRRSPAGRLPQWRKTLMNRDWLALDAASSAASSGC